MKSLMTELGLRAQITVVCERHRGLKVQHLSGRCFNMYRLTLQDEKKKHSNV